MKEIDKKYDRLISVIKNNPPMPENSERLTAGILAQIGRLSAKRRAKKRLILSGWISAIAATFLICLFVSETFFLPDGYRKRKTTFEYEVTAVPDHQPSAKAGLPAAEIQKIAPAEKYDLLRALINQKQEARTSRMQFRIDGWLRTQY